MIPRSDSTPRTRARRRARPLRGALFAVLATVATVVAGGPLGVGVASPARAADEQPDPIARSARGRAIALFDDVARAERGFALRAWVNDGGGGAIPIGSELAYHFEIDRAAHLTVVHLDSHGVATLVMPNGLSAEGEGSGALAAGRTHRFPDPDADFGLRAEPPVGQEHVLVVATARPITPADLGVPVAPGGFAVREAADAPALASAVLDRYLAAPVSERSAVHLEQHVVGRPGGAEYTSVDIVDYFTTRTRSIRRPRLDLHIHFETDSDALDPSARASLEEVAEALRDPLLREMRFTVAGHTDDTGTPAYNADLSRRRADRVIGYLVREQAIDPDRLDLAFHGETRPLESNATRDGRRMNRRVEFELRR